MRDKQTTVETKALTEAEQRTAMRALYRSVVIVGVTAVCTDCAERAGGIWIENRGTTFWSGACEVCERQEALCAPRDFRWPNGHRPTEWSVQR